MPMEQELRYLNPLSRCAYLSDRDWQLEYVFWSDMSAEKYLRLLDEGWRRAGYLAFHPRCPSCNACQSLRVLADTFRPNRSQRRTAKLNAPLIRLEISSPKPSPEKVDIYFRHHMHHALTKGWPETTEHDAFMHLGSLAESPFGVQEWRYYLEDRLVAVLYVDELRTGLSGIYYFFDPEYRKHSLGTWMIMTMIDRARHLKMPFVYLGYYVEGCRSMEYKARFRPNQILALDGQWNDFQV